MHRQVARRQRFQTGMPLHETTRTDSDRRATTEPALPRRRIAIFAEAVTLAHVARPLALARGLDPERYDVTFVCDPRYADFLAAEPWRIHWIDSISGERFRDALAKGRPIYDAATLQRYVDDDLAVIDAVRPDVVVGDFRLSLSASARLAAIPYAAICSTYWSPYTRQHYSIPDHPLVGMLGLATAQVLFDVFRPLAFAHHTRPLNRVRRSRGLPSLGLDLRRTYTDADWVLYADPPELVATERLPVNHRYLGPVLWSTPGAPPSWWADLPNDRPVVYVTMGSSGSQHDLATALDALSGVDCTVIAATAGGGPVSVRSSRQFVADYLPGEAASQRAQLVVCNGGAPTSQQALAAGRPVLGIARNLDQHLNMQCIERVGAGVRLRSDKATVDAVRRAVEHLLTTPAFAAAAGRLAQSFATQDAPRAFAAVVAEILGQPTGAGVTPSRRSAAGP
jgi:UDP:flavonoid glycosyltransferase YjiC (YdhE family)